MDNRVLTVVLANARSPVASRETDTAELGFGRFPGGVYER